MIALFTVAKYPLKGRSLTWETERFTLKRSWDFALDRSKALPLIDDIGGKGTQRLASRTAEEGRRKLCGKLDSPKYMRFTSVLGFATKMSQLISPADLIVTTPGGLKASQVPAVG